MIGDSTSHGRLELVGLVGYHVYAAITLNAFEVLDPGFDGENAAAPWEADARREEAAKRKAEREAEGERSSLARRPGDPQV